jgi:putative component of toxin-antitoxin plasmid stabilization module
MVMYTVERTEVFIDWLDGLDDRGAAARIAVRVQRMEEGKFGDVSRWAKA